MIYVSSLANVAATVAATGARHVVTAMSPQDPVVSFDGAHLDLRFHDVDWDMRPEYVPPTADHIDRLIAFVRECPDDAPIVFHCFAGVARSTACAFTALCMRAHDRPEWELAVAFRHVHPHARPNTRVIELADRALNRGGRMRFAIGATGPVHLVAAI